jgi:hypothetical protein
MTVQSYVSMGGVPELGVPDGSNLEAEFRRKPEVRRTMAAFLQQLSREPRNKGSSITTQASI